MKGENWCSSIEHGRLHVVPSGQLYARCGATAMRWKPVGTTSFEPTCRICRKRATVPPPAPPAEQEQIEFPQ